MKVERNIPRSILRMLTRFGELKQEAINRSGDVLFQTVKNSVRRLTYKTGFLFRNIEKRLKQYSSFQTIEVFTNVFYAGFLEYGTKYIKPRRMFALGLIEAKAKVKQEFVNSLNKLVSELQ